MPVARVNLSVRHPKRGDPMAITKVDAKGQRAKCPWVDKLGRTRQDWFTFKDLSLAEANEELRTRPNHENGCHQRQQRRLIDAPRQSTAINPLPATK